MDKYITNLLKYKSIIENRVKSKPKVGIILGSGLGGFADEMQPEEIISYSQLPDFPVSTVAGHRGRFVFGKIGNIDTVVMQGRVHYYEGYTPKQVVMPVRLMGLLGIQVLILTNAAGGINKEYKAGDFMLIEDHILFNVPSPLIGQNYDLLGPRFPDMSCVYDVNLRRAVLKAAQQLQIKMHSGVYVQASGPNYETPAEIKAFAAMGADAVGMSTAIEAIAANHMGIRVSGISFITNLAAGISPRPLSHEEVQTAADRSAPEFKALLNKVVSIL